MIEIKNLEKTYEDGNKAVKGISFKANTNKITGLIGFNGSGKTSTFNMMVDFIEEHGGEILFDGKKPNLEILRTISYLAAGSEPKNKTKAINHLHTIADMFGAKREWANSEIERLSKILDVHHSLNTKIASLSKGNQQKIKIIAALLNPNVKYMFLDEPFDGLDPIMIRRIQSDLMKLSKRVTMIITSHRMEVVQEMCEQFFLLKEGEIVESKKTSDIEVVVRVNKEVKKTLISKIKGIKKINILEDFIELTLKSIDDVKNVQKELLKSKDYVYSSYIEKNIAELVFRQYEEEVPHE